MIIPGALILGVGEISVFQTGKILLNDAEWNHVGTVFF